MKGAGVIWMLVLLGAVTVSSAPLLGDQPDVSPAECWKELMSRDDPAAASAQQEAVLAACGGRVEALRKLIQTDVAYEAFPAGWQKSSLHVGEGKDAYEVEFFFRVPAGYDGAKPMPLVLAAHGMGGEGRGFGRMIEGLLGEAADSYFILCPTMPGPKGFNARSYQEQAYLAPLAWARRRLNVDDDRVHITGYSQGGHVTWHLATLWPHLFAAAVPMAGMPCFEGGPPTATAYFENLAHLPLWAIWGEKDRVPPPAHGIADSCQVAAARLKELGDKNFTCTELPGVGHGNATPPAGKLAEYLAAHKRMLAPAKITHFFHMPPHGRAYYLQAQKLAHPPIDFSRAVTIRLAPGQEPSEQLIDDLIRKESQKQMFRLYGELNRSTNTVAVRAGGIASVRLLVYQDMLDPSKPVRVRFFGRAWTGKVPVSAACVLAHYATDRDQTGLVVNEIDLDIGGRAIVRYPK